MKCFGEAHLHGLGAGSCAWQACCPVPVASFRAGVWEPDPLIRVTAVKADPQNSSGGPARVGRTLHGVAGYCCCGTAGPWSPEVSRGGVKSGWNRV